jgi:hypothetical protein
MAYEMIKYDDTLYVAGNFQKANGAPADYIMKWNGSNWDSLEFSPERDVRCLYEYQGWLHIGGMFNGFGPLASKLIIKHFSGNLWATFPPVFILSRQIEVMKEYNNQLICAGSFGLQNINSVNIVGWDGFSFSPVDQGIEFSSGNPWDDIHNLAVFEGRLYASGSGTFLPNSGVGGQNIISWGGGSDWNNVGGGTNNDITDLQVYNGALYACGTFNRAGNVYTSGHIAKWDGTNWCSLGSTFDGTIWDMCVYNNELIVAGNFTHIDGIPVSHVAKWVGGNFVDSCSAVDINEIPSAVNSFSIFPNPATQNINITFSNAVTEISVFEIFNMLGEKVSEQKLPRNTKEFSLPVAGWPQGIYLCRLLTEKGIAVSKFVKQ